MHASVLLQKIEKKYKFLNYTIYITNSTRIKWQYFTCKEVFVDLLLRVRRELLATDHSHVVVVVVVVVRVVRMGVITGGGHVRVAQPHALHQYDDVLAELGRVERVEEEVERKVEVIEQTRDAFDNLLAHVRIQIDVAVAVAAGATVATTRANALVFGDQTRHEVVDLAGGHRAVEQKKRGRYDEQRAIGLRVSDFFTRKLAA